MRGIVFMLLFMVAGRSGSYGAKIVKIEPTQVQRIYKHRAYFCWSYSQ